MTTIPATMPEPGSVRHHQAEAAVLLRTLLDVDLPGLYWQLCPHATGLILVGQLYGDDDATRRGIDSWAAYLDAEVQTNTHEDYVQIAAETVRDGVQIRVWGLLKVTFSYVKTPAAAEGGAA